MKQIIMVGPALDAKGGISSVLRLYKEGGMFDAAHFLPSYVDGNPAQKLFCYAGFLVRYTWTLMTNSDIKLVHIHTSSGASFARKGIALLLARAFGKKVVLHMHGSTFLLFYEGLPKPLARLARFVLRRATVLLALSKSWQVDLFVLCQHPDIRVMYNPVLLQAPILEHCEPKPLAMAI